MNRVSKSLLIASIALLAVSCTASTKMIGVWSDPAYSSHIQVFSLKGIICSSNG